MLCRIGATIALGGHGQINNGYLIAPTLDSANALFAQYYMLRRVTRWETSTGL